MFESVLNYSFVTYILLFERAHVLMTRNDLLAERSQSQRVYPLELAAGKDEGGDRQQQRDVDEGINRTCRQLQAARH